MSRPSNELEALMAIDAALAAVSEPDVRRRIINWVISKYSDGEPAETSFGTPLRPHDVQTAELSTPGLAISQPGKMWLIRNGLDERTALTKIFVCDSGSVEIIATDVPGKSIRERAHSVFLLLGARAELQSGEFKFSDAEVRETCKHYNAFDVTNFTKHIKSMEGEVTGNKSSGYALTAKGQRMASELIRTMLGV